jgi:SMI1 / KNR4 family (SUKH-1)
MSDYDYVRRAVAALRLQDRALSYFGAHQHQYRFNATLTEADISAFEDKHGIELPPDYRGFLAHVGNGGAGPHYGVFKIGEMDGLQLDHKPWKEGVFVGVLREPWPHSDAWNFPQAELDAFNDRHSRMTDADLDEFDNRYWNEALVAGAIPICHEGCALRDWLVITGPEAGKVWHDARVDLEGLLPCERADGQRMRFMDWYLDWLQSALEAFEIRAL